MKKLFIVLAVASLGFVACNNEAETKEEVKTEANEAAEAAKDAIEEVKDSAAAAIDSLAGAVKDSLNK